jgi:glutamate-1-semialdehyde aminotransferase
LKRTHDKLEHKTRKLIDGITAAAEKHGHDITADCAGGMFGWFFTKGPVKNFSDAKAANADKSARWYRMMLERGVYLAPSMTRLVSCLLYTLTRISKKLLPSQTKYLHNCNHI